ncbi:hypothetical protein K469DRAFT_723232 [Zopfia rhizophila CBS 207.26]|uniref:Uncharacterized protein n=1 Tax=Zopfia rhizophila CBS 207.26 TaxID=1314779 RepID=A0A6A6DA26_9PEZI|nr:hypothetical protein K469DRAFT_723232 [Zopfia rhizophila CBS 207.26]
MVEPFTDNRRWHKLLFCAMVTWRQVFPHLPNLEHIGVGFCGRTDHPAPTYTNTFVTRYGKWVHWDENSMFVEDASVNLAWASAIVLQTVTKTVKSLHLSMANSDNLSSFATVNRLLTNCYRLLASMPLKAITKLALDLRGPEGTHGDRNWTGRTGTAGMVGYWKAILAFMPSLAHLEIYGADQHPKYQFNDNEDSTDRKGCILDWLTTGAFYRIESLSLRSLLVNKDTIPKIFAEEIRNLKRLHVEEVRLMTILDIEGDEPPELPDTTRGLAWWELGQWLSQNMSDVDVHIDRPISDVNGESQWKLHRKYIDKLSKLPGVELDVGGYYYTAVFLDPYEEESNTKEEAHGN